MKKYNKADTQPNKFATNIISLVFVVCIIFYLAFIKCSNPISERGFRNQVKAISLLRTIHTAQEEYKKHSQTNNYANNLQELGVKFHDEVITGQEEAINGYKFGILHTKAANNIYPASYSLTMYPQQDRGLFRTGDTWLFINETGIIRYVRFQDDLLDEHSKKEHFQDSVSHTYNEN